MVIVDDEESDCDLGGHWNVSWLSSQHDYHMATVIYNALSSCVVVLVMGSMSGEGWVCKTRFVVCLFCCSSEQFHSRNPCYVHTYLGRSGLCTCHTCHGAWSCIFSLENDAAGAWEATDYASDWHWNRSVSWYAGFENDCDDVQQNCKNNNQLTKRK